MKVACLTLVLCFAMTMVHQAEGGWWRSAVRFGKSAVSSVVGMIGKKERKRRELIDTVDEDTKKEMKKVCTENHLKDLTPDGIPFEIVKDTFEKVDGDGDDNDALNNNELNVFLDSLEVFKYCEKA